VLLDLLQVLLLRPLQVLLDLLQVPLLLRPLQVPLLLLLLALLLALLLLPVYPLLVLLLRSLQVPLEHRLLLRLPPLYLLEILFSQQPQGQLLRLLLLQHLWPVLLHPCPQQIRFCLKLDLLLAVQAVIRLKFRLFSFYAVPSCFCKYAVICF
jgi:hypothetical protein